MINKTKKSLVLISGETLDKKIRESMITTHNYFINYHGFQAKLNLNDRHKSGQILLRHIFLNDKNTYFGNDFVDFCTNLSYIFDESSLSCEKIEKFVHLYIDVPVDPRFFGPLKTSIRLFLVELWHRDAILLSYYFAPKITTHHKFIESRIKPVFTSSICSKYQEVRYHWRRFSLMLDWKIESDIDLNDLWAIATFKHNNNVTSNLPVIALIKHISEIHPEYACKNDVDLINSYVKFLSTKPVDFSGVSYEDYKDLKNKHINSRTLSESDLELTTISEGDSVIDPLKYFMALKSKVRTPDNLNWIFDCSFYIGLEYVDHSLISEQWIKYISGFFAFTSKTYVSFKAKRSNIYLLCDYLFGYLPLWFEQNKTSEFRFPMRPEEFSRDPFWSSSFSNDTSVRPQDLSSLVLSRNSRETFSSFLNTIHNFFEYCSVTDNNRSYNPISLALDAVGSGSRRIKTNKIPIDLNVYPFVCRLLSAIEIAGEELQKISLSTDRFEIISVSRKDIVLSDFGISQSISLNGVDCELEYIPMKLFQWHRGLYGKGDNSRLTYMPMLSALRMLNIALHTGLRLQNVQWLDIFTFDQCYKAGVNSYFTPVLVNTDKSLNQRFCNFNPSAMRSALKEKEFQLQLSNEPYVKVPYENNIRSILYDPISALFRSPFSDNKSFPFSDTIYLNVWSEIQVLMSEIYNKHFNKDLFYQFYFYTGIRDEKNTNAFKVNFQRNLFSDGPTDSPYSPIKTQPVHTPHSLRSTYITLRRPFDIDLQILGQVGHANLTQTNYYTVDSGVFQGSCPIFPFYAAA